MSPVDKKRLSTNQTNLQKVDLNYTETILKEVVFNQILRP